MNKKILTVVIPCFNSVAYMEKAITSIIAQRDRVELIIVDDGSEDETYLVAKKFQDSYPEDIIAISQPNGGHGSAVNTGIKYATGYYFKVLDSDDWFDEDALTSLLNRLTQTIDNHDLRDAFLVNYVYAKQGKKKNYVMHYRKYLETNSVLSWNEIYFPLGKYLMMHSFIHRTEILKEKVCLPKHTFYVDNLYLSQSIPSIQTLEYLDIDLYYYFIGRDDQSINTKVMIDRIDQQLFVNYAVLKDVQKAKLTSAYDYLFHHFEIVTAVSMMMLLLANTPTHLQKKADLWAYIEAEDDEIYEQFRKGLLGTIFLQKWKGSRPITVFIYKIVRKVFHFN